MQSSHNAGAALGARFTTGCARFRRSDAVLLNWSEISFPQREIEHECKKNHKIVVLSIGKELLGALTSEYERRTPLPSDPVLVNSETGKRLTEHELYRRIKALGKRAGVKKAHPHKSRCSFAVDLLLKGADTYYVAKMLGDTVETVIKHYLPFVKDLRDRARAFIDADNGIED